MDGQTRPPSKTSRIELPLTLVEDLREIGRALADGDADERGPQPPADEDSHDLDQPVTYAIAELARRHVGRHADAYDVPDDRRGGGLVYVDADHAPSHDGDDDSDGGRP